MSRYKLITVIAILGVATFATPASAQVLGTFPWQMQPYCNIVTLTLTTAPAGFTLDGTDDQCGANNKASAVGVASFNASGNVTLNFTIVTAPAGKPVHVSAVVSPADGSGAWTDSVGNTGTFAFFGNTSGLPGRPFPASGLAAGSVTGAEIAAATVGAVQLAANAVTGASVANGSLTTADLADGPRAAFADGDQTLNVAAGTTVTVRSVTLTAPAAGKIVVNASFEFKAGVANAIELGRCSISTGALLDGNHLHRLGEEGGTGVTTTLASSFSATRGFNVAAGPFTVNIVCDALFGPIEIRDSSLTAMYFPG